MLRSCDLCNGDTELWRSQGGFFLCAGCQDVMRGEQPKAPGGSNKDVYVLLLQDKKNITCLHCKQPGATRKVKPCTYHGTASYVIERKKGETDEEYYRWFHPECFEKWWNDLTWHLDTLDERMNANIHFIRIRGSKGTYMGKPADASWNGMEARHFLGEYVFSNRRPHPTTCQGCPWNKKNTDQQAREDTSPAAHS